MQSGFLIINKPSGISSNFVLTKIKKCLPRNTKIGHLGTLDPLASGVLPIAIGRATKLFDMFLKKTKSYNAIICFGAETNTLDSEGTVIKQSDVLPNYDQVCQACTSLVGEYQQLIPTFSANNINGERAYDLARKGIEFEQKTKLVNISYLKCLQQIDDNKFLISVECSSGTYIRSLCRDIAEKCGTVGYMGALVRTRCGEFKIEDSVNLGKLTSTNITEHIALVDKVLTVVPKLNIPYNLKSKLTVGNVVTIPNYENIKPNTNLLVYCNSQFLGIGKLFEDNNLKLLIHLYDI